MSDIMLMPRSSTVSPSHTVEECMRLMTDKRIRHLPVVDGYAIAGIVSIGDLGALGYHVAGRNDSVSAAVHQRTVSGLGGAGCVRVHWVRSGATGAGSGCSSGSGSDGCAFGFRSRVGSRCSS